MIRRLRVNGYKSLKNVDVDFDALTVVFGANSAGKSNLFDALALLSRITTEADLDSAFDRHRGDPLEAFTLDESGLAGLQAQNSARFTIEADVQLSPDVVAATERKIRVAREGLESESPEEGESAKESDRTYVKETFLRYSVTVEVRPASAHLRVIDESLRALREDGEPRKSRAPFLETSGPRVTIRMERQGHPRYEESGQDRAVISRSFYPPHHPHITAFREEVSRWRFYYLEPTAMRNEVPLRDVGSLDTAGHQIAAFFNTVKVENPRQLNAHARALKAVIPRFGGLDVQRTDQGRVRLVAEENGREVSANLLSEGTLRVLGLLAILNPVEPVSVVGYEEPENGVHPRRLQLVADMLLRAARRGSPQLIVNTHSPLIPEYLYGQEGVALVVCARDAEDYSFYCNFEEFAQGEGGLFVGQDVGIALDPDSSTLGERLVRGDFGG